MTTTIEGWQFRILQNGPGCSGVFHVRGVIDSPGKEKINISIDISSMATTRVVSIFNL